MGGRWTSGVGWVGRTGERGNIKRLHEGGASLLHQPWHAPSPLAACFHKLRPEAHALI